MARALKFSGIFLGVSALLSLMIFGPSLDAFRSLVDNRESMAEGSEWVETTFSTFALTEYIAAHPDRVSVTRLVSDPQSAREEIHYRDSEPRTQGALSTLFLLAGYADAFYSGEMDPGRRLNWEDTLTYLLPKLGEALHEEAYQYGRDQQLIDTRGSLTLESALQILALYPAPALSDYLLLNLGEERLMTLFEALKISETDLPLPFSGLFVTLAPSIQEQSAEQLLDRWSSEDRELFRQEVYRNTRQFFNGTRRSEWLETLKSERLGTNFMEERDLLALYPATTARELARTAKELITAQSVPAEVGKQVLGWIRQDLEKSYMGRHVTRLGSLQDNRLGLLDGLAVGTTPGGETTIQAIFFDRIHIAVWLQMSSNHLHQEFQNRLLWDRELLETLKQATGV